MIAQYFFLFSGMPHSTGMELFHSSMKLVEVYHNQYADRQIIEGVLAAIGSTLVAVGGVVLIIVTSGAAAGVVVPAWKSLMAIGMIGSGISGAAKAITSTANGKFSLLDWSVDFIVSAGTTLIAFASGAGAGLLGVQLTSGFAMSNAAIKSLATAMGGLAGAGARTGTYVVHVSVIKGEKISMVEIIMEGIIGK